MSNKKFLLLNKNPYDLGCGMYLDFVCVSSTIALAGQTWLDNGWIY